MDLTDLATKAIGLLIAIGAVCAGGGYAYGQFSEGRLKQKKAGIDSADSLLQYLRNENDAYKELIEKDRKDHNEEIKNMGERVAALEAQLKEKEKTIEAYTAIFKDRDPATQQFQQDMRGFFAKISKTMESVDGHLSRELKISATVK